MRVVLYSYRGLTLKCVVRTFLVLRSDISIPLAERIDSWPFELVEEIIELNSIKSTTNRSL